VLSRFTVSADDPDSADRDSEHVIFEIDQPWGNHNGCTILFGPDGYMYFSLGDGGSANDPLRSGQDLTTLLGTILRIDVSGSTAEKPYAVPADNPFVGDDEAQDEIWAFGLRNVWRMSFDRETGDLWAGDVGQNKWEEIDLIVKGGNYGWDIREGAHEFKKNKQPSRGPLIDPVTEYPRASGLSVTGGYVYRGTKQPSLVGVYLYADYASGRVWGLRYENGSVTEQREVLEPIPPKYISSFGEDEAGEVYVTTFDKHDGRGSTGRVFRVTAY
jgi:quinoprotein glucose dehydrogenase